MLEILLAKGHPKTRTLDGWIVDYQRFYLLVVHQIALTRTNLRISERLVNLQRFGLYPLSVLPIESFLGYLTNVDFGVEVGGKCLAMVAGIAINDVEVMYLLEMVLCCSSSVDASHAWVESAAQDCGKASLLKTFAIGPLPAVFEVSLIARLIIGSVKIVHTTLQTCFHNG